MHKSWLNKALWQFIFWLTICSCLNYSFGQSEGTDLSTLTDYYKLSKEFNQNQQYDSVIHYLNRGLAFPDEPDDRLLLPQIYFDLGLAYSKTGRFSLGTENQLKSIELKKAIGDSMGIGLSLNHIGFNYDDLGEYETAIAYYEQSMQYREALNDLSGVAWNLNNIGVAYINMGDNVSALEYYERALKIRESIGDQKGVAASLSNMSTIYFNRGDHVTAIDFLHRVLKIVDKNGDKYQRANVLQNLGSFYSAQQQYEKSLEQSFKVLELRKELGDITMTLSTMGNIAVDYSNLGQDEKCVDMCHEIIRTGQKEGLESYSGVAFYLLGTIYEHREQYDSAIYWIKQDPALMNYENDPDGASRVLVLGRIYAGQGKLNKAIDWLEIALTQAIEMRDFHDLKNISEELYKAYKKNGNSGQALESLELYNLYRDSLMSEGNQRALIETEYRYSYEKAAIADSISNAKASEIKNAQIAQQQAEIKAKKNQQYGLLSGLALMVLLAGVFLFQRNRISKEKDRNEELLLNILPAETAQELKEKGSSDAVLIDQVTVLFTDFKGFTAMSEKLKPTELVKDLHECFSAFDLICEKYSIEKIKTIGDAYMAAGGLPTPNNTHAQDVVLAALGMALVVEKGKTEKIEQGLPFFEIRIGIHTGPVVAGIVGVKKFQYDIWGDTVNTASRMESSGEVGKVNISHATYELLKEDSQFAFKSRGKIETKSKGEMEMYFVSQK